MSGFQPGAFQPNAFQGAQVATRRSLNTSGGAPGGAGPDAQVPLPEFMRRWGPQKRRQPFVLQDDEEAIEVLLCAIAADMIH